jgi:putative flippase GtrA
MNAWKINRQERARFLKFTVVGIIGAIVDFGIMNLFSRIFGMALIWAGTISFISAILSNFLWNRYWTYPDSRSKPVAHQLVMFALVNVAGLVVRLPILHFLELPIRGFFTRLDLGLPFTPLFWGKNVTLAIAVGIVMLWNFFVNRYWTYNDVDKKESGAEAVILHEPRT